MNAPRIIPDSIRERQARASDPKVSSFVAAERCRADVVYLGLTLQHEPEITAYESHRPAWATAISK